MPGGRPRLDLGSLLAAVEDAPPVAAADVLGAHLAELLGASAVAFLIADLSGEALIRLTHGSGRPSATHAGGRDVAERVPLVGTAQGRVLARQEIEIETVDDGVRLHAPVTNRGEAIGVLELTLPEEPDEQSLADVALAAHALAYVIIANRRFTDLFEWGQRSIPLSLAAEIQHRLLPSAYTCEAGQFTLAAWLEPAGDVAGDTFDFSVDRETLHLSLTDAVGHEVGAAMVATVLVGALRNARRAGGGLAEQARLASAALARHTPRDEFATGQLVRVDLPTCDAIIVNAGHPAPLRLRRGRVAPVTLEVDLPFGTGIDDGYRVQSLSLEPGDRLMFVTDGMLERNAAGLDLPALIGEGARLHPREAVQHVVRALLGAVGDDLRDDATVLCLDWHGGRPRPRSADAGADR